MPRFTIRPSDNSFTADVTALYPEAVLHVVEQFECREADVLRDGIYSFSVRLNEHGLWSIFQRDDPAGAPGLSLVG